jgi:hypothetical protein
MIALCCGYRGLCVIDVDTDDAEKLAAVLRVLPRCRVGRFGSKGFALFARYEGVPKSFNIYCGPRGASIKTVEVKGIGQNITVPPSIHFKTGNPYRWINPETGEELEGRPSLDELPVITDDDFVALVDALAPWATPAPPPREASTFDPDKVARNRHDAWYRTALTNAQSRLSGLASGRPTELFNTACALGAGVHHGFIPQREFEDALLDACAVNGLLKREGRHAILSSIASGLSRAVNDALPDLGEARPTRRMRKNGSLNGTNGSLNGNNGMAQEYTNGASVDSLATHSEHKANGHDAGTPVGKVGKTSAEDAKTFPGDRTNAPAGPDLRPVIQIKGGSLSRNATEAEEILFNAKVSLYHQAGQIVRPSRCSLRDNRGDQVMVPSITEARSIAVYDSITTHARIQKWDKRAPGGGAWIDCEV